MSEYKNLDVFTKAYNNFDLQPLRGEKLRSFYVGDFFQESVDSIRTTVQISERFRKMLVIGHMGCGKSTVLHKVAEELTEDYHTIFFSVLDTLNMMDVATVDILLNTYVQLLVSLEELDINYFAPFEKMMEFLKKEINIEEVGINFLEVVSLKFRVEDDTREIMRKKFRNNVDTLVDNIAQACRELEKHTNKEVLIIIDDIDKLETKFADQIFFKDSHLLMLPDTKIIFTFPLDSYYCPSFNNIKDKFEDQFISLVNLHEYDGSYQEKSLDQLKELVFKRIDYKLVDDDALKSLIDYSGGLLRDVVHHMQSACKLAIVNKSDVIDNVISEKILQKNINDYSRRFDFLSYENETRRICETKKRNSVGNKVLTDLLRYLFVLEYRSQDKTWYEVHPCLQEILKRNGE